MTKNAIALAVTVVVCVAAFLFAIDKGRESDLVALDRYCLYGAVSQIQYEGCVDHVDPDSIDDRTTNAADYARFEITQCLADAGPLCIASKGVRIGP